MTMVPLITWPDVRTVADFPPVTAVASIFCPSLILAWTDRIITFLRERA